MAKLYLDEVLDENRKKILKELYLVFKDEYYLAGGTALALQIAHRLSLDFDLFKNKSLNLSLKQKFVRFFNKYSPKVLVDTSDEFSVVLIDEVKVTFLNYFWDPLFPLIKIKNLLPFLSLKDIATTKAYSLGRRGNYRDYFDLYSILNGKYCTLNQILQWSKKKYSDLFSERIFLEQLVYLEDIILDKELKYLKMKEVSIKELEKFFSDQVKNLRK